jgi:hypothetical protein
MRINERVISRLRSLTVEDGPPVCELRLASLDGVVWGQIEPRPTTDDGGNGCHVVGDSVEPGDTAVSESTRRRLCLNP